MSSPREIVMMAQDLYLQLGVAGVALADARAHSREIVGDTRGADYWRCVARGMIVLAVAPNALQTTPADGPKSASLVWSLMQRIEAYRHLAMEAEEAASAADGETSDLATLAAGWRQLAATFEQMAGSLDELLPAERFYGSPYELN